VGEVIKCWDEGIKQLSKGTVATLTCTAGPYPVSSRVPVCVLKHTRARYRMHASTRARGQWKVKDRSHRPTFIAPIPLFDLVPPSSSSSSSSSPSPLLM
jgi:hypothetical protein